jgi:hypothetical protein
VFVREKRINGYTYLYLVESVRENGRAKQRIIKNLGRKEAVVASGELERLASSVARYAERAVVLSQLEAGNPDGLACTRIGAPLLFGRLWEETGCKAVVEELLNDRGFEFAVERAVFATVLHRLMVSGSDRACEKWLGDYAIPGVDGLALHHLYRAMTGPHRTRAMGPGPGWARSCPPTSSRVQPPSPRARSRTWSRRRCSRVGATCSPSSRWCGARQGSCRLGFVTAPPIRAA